MWVTGTLEIVIVYQHKIIDNHKTLIMLYIHVQYIYDIFPENNHFIVKRDALKSYYTRVPLET